MSFLNCRSSIPSGPGTRAGQSSARQSRTRILHSFGRKEELDTDQLRRLKEQFEAYLPPEEQADGAFGITDTWQLGGRDGLDSGPGGGDRELEVQHFHRAMDFLAEEMGTSGSTSTSRSPAS